MRYRHLPLIIGTLLLLSITTVNAQKVYVGDSTTLVVDIQTEQVSIGDEEGPADTVLLVHGDGNLSGTLTVRNEVNASSEWGIYTFSSSSEAIRAESAQGDAVYAMTSASSSNRAAVNAQGGNSVGIIAASTLRNGVKASSVSDNGIYGSTNRINTSTFAGVKGYATSACGVIGESAGGFGVKGMSNSNYGLHGLSTTFHGIYATTKANANNRYALFAFAPTARGVLGESLTRVGVEGKSRDRYGVLASSVNSYGVFAGSQSHAAYFRTSSSSKADIVLGGSPFANASGDDGVIMSDPSFLSSDIYLVSNDDLIIRIDDNSEFNDAGKFEIQNGLNSPVMTCNEFGDLSLNGDCNIDQDCTVDGKTDLNGQVQMGVSTLLEGELNVNADGRPAILTQAGGTEGDIVVPDGEAMQFGHWNTSTNNFTEVMSFRSNGDFRVENGAFKPGGGNWSSTSDRRLKDRIEDYEDGLDLICKIRPVTYHYNEKSGYDTEVRHIGVVAQELQEVTPYMVGTHEISDGEYLQVDNSAMVYMLINAVKEQQEIITQLNQKLSEQSAENTALESRLDALESLTKQVAYLREIIEDEGRHIGRLGSAELKSQQNND